MEQVIREYLITRTAEELSGEEEKKILLNEFKATNDKAPKYAYRLELRGQGAYILEMCSEKGIQASCSYGQVMIYSKKKVPEFVRIITESFDYEKMEDPPPLPHTSTSFWEGHRLICVIENECVHVTEDKLQRLVYYEFIKSIPTIKMKKIYRRKVDMEEQLMEQKILI